MNTSSTAAFTLNEVLKASWDMTKKNWVNYLILGGAIVLVYLAYGIVYGLINLALGLPEIIDSILSAFVGVLVSIMSARAALTIARGEKLVVQDTIKLDGKTYLQAVIATFLFYLVIGVGLVFLIIPGIIAAVMFSFYMYSLVDKRLDGVPALEHSMRMTEGNRLTIFLFHFALCLIALVIIGIPVVLLLVLAASGGEFNSTSVGPLILGGILVVVVAVVVGTILGMVNMSGQAYMYLKLSAKTPLQIKK